MRTAIVTLFIVMLLSACQFKLPVSGQEEASSTYQVERYDRLQSMYLTTGDFTALQQMETEYPMETRTLIEKVLKIGSVDDPNINKKFLAYYQDSTLQTVISDAEVAYANMDDINSQLTKSFNKLKGEIPDLELPRVYAQIGSFDQSIVVADESVGISLDKYMGADYSIYKRYYTPQQRRQMTREYIVPDCLCFYLLGLYPMKDFETQSQRNRDLHMGRVMWVCNQLLENKFFKSSFVDEAEKFVRKNNVKMKDLLSAPV